MPGTRRDAEALSRRTWEPDPEPGDGPDGRGEAGGAEHLSSRAETEEASRTGRFPEGDEVRDASTRIEPAGDRSELAGDEEGEDSGH